MNRRASFEASDFDVLLLGGGLASGLIALATLSRKPDASIAVIERDQALGGNHTWCLHAGDAGSPDSPAHAWLAPLITHRWDGYDVRYPRLTRTVAGGYAAITSERFDRVLRAALASAPNASCLRGETVVEASAQRVVLADGRRLSAGLVIDARGAAPGQFRGRCGYQKFVGLELAFAEPHGLSRPVLMDATVPQEDGLRFMYVLPLAERRLLIEDTVFSRRDELQAEAMREAVLAHARRYGAAFAIERTEQGVLPMPWADTTVAGGSAPARADGRADEAGPLLAGLRGGYLHPATGYSLPAAVRLAQHVADQLARGGPRAVVGPALSRLRRAHRSQTRFFERLNWMLFHWFAEEDMRNVLERFYRLPAPLLHRFYALETTRSDRARILLGIPPRGLSVSAAVSSTLRRAAPARASGAAGAAP